MQTLNFERLHESANLCEQYKLKSVIKIEGLYQMDQGLCSPQQTVVWQTFSAHLSAHFDTARWSHFGFLSQICMNLLKLRAGIAFPVLSKFAGRRLIH